MASSQVDSSPASSAIDLKPSHLDVMKMTLNKSLLRKISKALEENPSLDFESLLHDATADYKRRLQNLIERGEKGELGRRPPTSPTSLSYSYGHQDPTARTMVISPLDLELPNDLRRLEAQQQSMTSSPVLGKQLARLIEQGKCLFSGPSRVVVQLNDNTVVKFGPSVSDETSILEYLGHHSDIPVPKPRGFLTIGSTSYMFMSYIPGESLENRWPWLTMDQKSSVRSELDFLMSRLRNIPRPASAPLGTLASPHVCKIARRNVFVSPPDLRTVAQFHDFLLSNPYPHVSSRYLAWLRSLLNDDYRIVLTHGDYDSRNIMVVDDPDGSVRISGIIDWEMGGWYPEYWETYRARSNRDGNDDSDWWDFLPNALLGYEREVLERRVIEQSMKDI